MLGHAGASGERRQWGRLPISAKQTPELHLLFVGDGGVRIAADTIHIHGLDLEPLTRREVLPAPWGGRSSVHPGELRTRTTAGRAPRCSGGKCEGGGPPSSMTPAMVI